MPNGRCDQHGGKSTGPPWKTGQYSKELEPFRAMLRGRALDPELLHGALFEKLALLDEAEDALLSRGFNEGDTPGFRQEALKLYRKGATEARDEDLSTPLSWERLGELLEKGAEYDRVLAEAAAMAGKRMKQTVDLRAVMSQEESAAHRLACKLQIVVGVVYQVLGEELGVKKAEPIIGAVHQRLLGGKARGLTIDTEARDA